MRPKIQAQIIQSKLEIIKEIKMEVKQLQDLMDNILENGKSWIEETGDQKTFFEFDHYLTIQTSICIEKCLHIATENKELTQTVTEHDTSTYSPASDPIFKDSQNNDQINKKFEDNDERISQLEKILKINEEKCSKIVKIMDKQSNKVKNLEREIQKQKEENETWTKQNPAIDTRLLLKYEEVMTELQSASNFMSHLNSQTETLTQTVNENKQNIQTLTEKLNGNDELIHSVFPLVEMFKEMQNKLKEQEDQINKVNDTVKETEDKNRVHIEWLRLLQTQVPDIETKLHNLETSTDIFKKKYEEKSEKLELKEKDFELKFTNISSQVQDMLLKKSNLDSKNNCVAVSVISELSDLTLHQDEIINCMTNILYITGDIFDSDTGIFTAPFEGLYLCCVSFSTNSNDEVLFHIITKDSKGNEETIGCLFNVKDRSLRSSVIPVFMKQNDELYLKSLGNYQLSDFYIQFACILIQ